MSFEIEDETGDDDAYIQLVRETVAGAVKASHVEEVYVVRIDNWFDRKWLKFSGIKTVPFESGVLLREEALAGCHKSSLTMPPFHPNRVESWRYYSWNGYSGEFVRGLGKFVPHRRQMSESNLDRRVVDVSNSVAFVWYTGNTKLNGRGSLMMYLAREGETDAWFASLVRDGEWKVQSAAGIALDYMHAFAAEGRSIAQELNGRIRCEEEALSRELHRAIDKADLVRMSELIAGDVDLEGRDKLGRTALLHALYEAHWDLAKHLLVAGANPFQQDYQGYGALHMCCFDAERGPEDEPVLGLLLEKGIDVNARKQSGATPLMTAAGNVRPACVKMLLQGAAELEAKDQDRETALHYACRREASEVVQLLIEAGAKVGARDKLRSTPIFKAVRRGDLASVKLLHAAGASVRVKNKLGWTPLLIAEHCKHVEVIELLKSLGA